LLSPSFGLTHMWELSTTVETDYGIERVYTDTEKNVQTNVSQ
jgi:hypothetical protein